MGIYIGLNIFPERITAEDWREVYQETLELLDAYPFMDCIWEEKNGIKYYFARRSQHRDNLFDRGFAGWQSVGDMKTGYNTEEFVLYSEIEAYKGKSQKKDNGRDLLINELQDERFEKLGSAEGEVTVWCDKTQGKDSHLYLLAIACLISDRFPNAAIVYGNINYEQIDWAVEWANDHLKKPIGLPVTADMEKLLRRIQNFVSDSNTQLDVFFELTENEMNKVMREFLQRKYSHEQLYNFYIYRFNQLDPTTYASRDALQEYFKLNLDFRELVEILCIDPNGRQMDTRAFLNEIVRAQYSLNEKETYAFLEDTIKYCEGVLGTKQEIETMLEYILIQVEKDKDTILNDELVSLIRKSRAEKRKEYEESIAKYDISTLTQIIDFKEGDTINPDLDESFCYLCRKAREFGSNDFSDFLLKNITEREIYFLERCKNWQVMLKEEVWNHIFQYVTDDEYIFRFYGIFKIDCSHSNINLFVSTLLNNLNLLDYFWKKTEQTIESSLLN